MRDQDRSANDGTPLQLRPARLSEAPAMAGMSRTLVEAGLGWRYTPPRMAALIDDPDTVTLVACESAQLHGMAVMHFGETQAHLVLLCVAAAQQRLGIGRRLVDWLLASAQVAGIHSVGLELRADNPAALAFYHRLGFSETRLVPGYYDGRIAARRMQRMLGPETALR
jgi:ribosomal protein S18 acetylase RimI-like enzyme